MENSYNCFIWMSIIPSWSQATQISQFDLKVHVYNLHWQKTYKKLPLNKAMIVVCVQILLMSIIFHDTSATQEIKHFIQIYRI